MQSAEIGRTRWRTQKVFAGREAGHACREFFRLDELDKVGREIRVTISEEVYSVNASFFLGMFGDSIRSLGKDRFRSQYHFMGKGISRTLNSGIRHALDRTARPRPSDSR